MRNLRAFEYLAFMKPVYLLFLLLFCNLYVMLAQDPLQQSILKGDHPASTNAQSSHEEEEMSHPVDPLINEMNAEDEEESITFAQEMPQYPGGELQMQRDIMENLLYPEMEKENNIQGKVYVQFVVEKDGSVSNVRVQRGVQGGPNLSRVAENAVKKLKRFEPAKNNGRPVRILMTIPVNFTL